MIIQHLYSLTVWYSGAYTVQLATIPVNQGRVELQKKLGWLNNATLGPYGPSVIVDGVSITYYLTFENCH
jgi:hypothetical protein